MGSILFYICYWLSLICICVQFNCWISWLRWKVTRSLINIRSNTQRAIFEKSIVTRRFVSLDTNRSTLEVIFREQLRRRKIDGLYRVLTWWRKLCNFKDNPMLFSLTLTLFCLVVLNVRRVADNRQAYYQNLFQGQMISKLLFSEQDYVNSAHPNWQSCKLLLKFASAWRFWYFLTVLNVDSYLIVNIFQDIIFSNGLSKQYSWI